MSKLRRSKEQRKADREQKKQTPKVKMRSYGGGEKLPIVKTGKDFYLADQKYDNLGVGEFSGQKTGKLEGPSKRAIKGKGKKSGNVRVADKQDEVGNEIFLKDTSPMKIKNDYSSMKSMGQAVARWTSPNKLTGEASKKEQDKESVKKYGVAGSSKRTKKAVKSIAKDDAKAKKAKEKFEKSIEYKVDKKATKKQAKKDYKESEEGKEATAKKREKATDITQAIGRAMAAAGGTTVKTPSKTVSQKGKEQRDKEKKDKDKEKLKEQDSSKTNLEKSDIGAKT